MDAFFASVEQRDFPEIRGLPVVVGGRSQRGVVAAASYEARKFGVRSAMPMREALQRCPDLICQNSRMSTYQEVSSEVFEIFNEFTSHVEGLSLDEAFLDISASLTLLGTPLEIGNALKRRVYDKTRLRVSVGIANNKLLAKIASDLDKPDGLTIIEPANVHATLDPLPVRTIPGIGPKTLPRLARLGIRTIGDLRLAENSALESVFGKQASRVRARAGGEDNRPVERSSSEKSISAEETFAEDTLDRALLGKELLGLAEKTATRVRAKNLLASTVQVKIRRADFKTFTRQAQLRPPSHNTDAIYNSAVKLLDTWLEQHPASKIRLLGVGISDFSEISQIDLFAEPAAEVSNALDKTVDSIRERFGGAALTRARTMDSKD